MKKIVTLVTAALMAVLLVLPAMAADVPADGGAGYSAAEVLNAYWKYYEGVPDYSSGYWLDENGVLTVGLVDEAGRDEVLAIVGDAPVNFVSHTYSYNELWNTQLAIEPFMGEDVGIMTIGVDVMNNVTEVGIDLSNPAAEGFMEKMFARHGDRVAFKELTGLTVAVDLTVGEEPPAALAAAPGKGLSLQTAVTLLCVIGLGGAVLLLAHSRQMARQVRTADGRTVTSAPVTRRETEEAVKNTVAEPDTTLRDIVEKIEE